MRTGVGRCRADAKRASIIKKRRRIIVNFKSWTYFHPRSTAHQDKYRWRIWLVSFSTTLFCFFFRLPNFVLFGGINALSVSRLPDVICASRFAVRLMRNMLWCRRRRLWQRSALNFSVVQFSPKNKIKTTTSCLNGNGPPAEINLSDD